MRNLFKLGPSSIIMASVEVETERELKKLEEKLNHLLDVEMKDSNSNKNQIKKIAGETLNRYMTLSINQNHSWTEKLSQIYEKYQTVMCPI